MRIEVLPDSVSSAIAAGEVVERPSSVVRELVENSLDADATRIEIEIEDAGRRLIQVSDDGYGIPADELPLAVERFATSKLRTAEELNHIHTLGFRGEALSSIGAVSRLDICSRSTGQTVGSTLRVEAGELKGTKSEGTTVGTQVTVRNLFFNVPARIEFLKSDRTERRWISKLITRYALAYPEVSFKLSQEGRESFHSPGNGDRRVILAEIYGVKVASELLPLPEGASTHISVEGFVSPPHIHRSNRSELTFFVNGRWIQDASLTAAVLQAYHTLLMVGRFPIVVLFLEIPPDSIDVNVHPAKAEIRFRDPRKVFSVVQRAVRATLLGQSPSPGISLGTRWANEQAAQIDRSEQDWSFWHETQEGSLDLKPADHAGGLASGVPLLRPVGQVGSSYLVAEGPDGLYLIDQHAAHERVLFEQFMQASQTGKLEVQKMLDPVVVEFSPEESESMEEHLSVINELGFEVEHFGPRAFRILAVPAMLIGKDAGIMLRSVVDEFEEDETPLEAEIEARIAARVCKRVAVKAGQVLARPEQEQLLRDLEACTAPRTCPHGRPTMIHLSVESLERQFGRR